MSCDAMWKTRNINSQKQQMQFQINCEQTYIKYNIDWPPLADLFASIFVLASTIYNTSAINEI